MTIISSSTETEFDFSEDGQSVAILQGVYLEGEPAIRSDHPNNTILNYGDIFGYNYTIMMEYDGGNSQEGSIFNAPGATIQSLGNAVTMEQDNSTVNNSGIIQASDVGLDLYGDNTILANSGTINTSGDGVRFTAASLSFNNSGTINSEGDGLNLKFTSNKATSIHNSGLISGDGLSVDVAGDGSGVLNLTNSGTLDGSTFLGNQTTNLVNTGTIDGTTELGSGQDAVRNYGILNGDLDLYAIAGGNTETIYNRGTIQGDVNLGNGGSTFDGHRGTVTGTITGGTGADTIAAGDDGETMAGGKGHDVLYGGAGADTFAFASGAASDTDVVHRFDVAKDTIQLAHSAYAHLVAGETPTFSIGTSANSSTDYLFYNAGTGGLYYDSNGSAAGGAYLIATFDKGLNLTAQHFSVV